MPAHRTHRRGRLALLVSAVLAISGVQLFLAAPSAQASGSTTLVISEVYGGGGATSGTPYSKSDFVELYNPSGTTQSLNGLSLQYRAQGYTTGTPASITLPNVGVASHAYYLIEVSSGTFGPALPVTPDLTSTALNMSATQGQVLLVNGTGGFTATGDLAGNPGLVDMVGYGTTTSSFETARTGAQLSNTTSASRNATGTDTDNNSTDFGAPGAPSPTAGGSTASPLSLTNPGAQANAIGDTVAFTPSANGGTPPYAWSATGLPAGLSINPTTGAITGSPTTVNTYNTQVTVEDNASPTHDTKSVSFTWDITATTPITSIATIQGTGARSSLAGTGNTQGTTVVTTEGVITGIYNKGYASSGAASCGLCGFTIQTGGSGPATDSTPGASDGIFVYGFSTFTATNSTGGNLAVGQSVRVTGKVSEFSVGGDTAGSLTELNLSSGAASIVAIPALTAPTPNVTVPALADREAHESETISPAAGNVVITDVYNYETSGELGLATGGKPLVQPTELCADDDTTCIAAKRQDIRERGWFLDDASTTAYLTSSTFYSPQNSNNSDIPLPYMDAGHSARVGAGVTFPAGKPGVISYGAKKWYMYPQRAIQSTPEGTPDLGSDVIDIENTRTANAAPAPVGGNVKIATYNVENFFNITMEAFAAANPYYTCQYDDDRQGNHILAFQCTSPQAIPSAFDPTTGAPTAYSSGLVSAPRGAGRQADLDRQTSKIVKAINGLGADIVSLEELGNPNKLRKGVTQGPLADPNPNVADGGLGTPIAWRDETINYLVEKLNADLGAEAWSFVASPEESTDATAVNHMCATVNPNGTTIQPPQTNGTCSWASGQDVIRSGFLYKKASVVPVGPSDIDFPNSSAPVPSPFDNAREPLAQFFKPVGHPNSDGFAVIVNHFKSKGDADAPAGPATGDNADNDLTGAFNGDRTRQAKELVRFANEFADKWNTTKVFLVGDFNSYTKEDPIEAIVNPAPGSDDLDFDVVTSDDPDDLTYVFTATVDGIGYGGAGSLDHVLASADARAMISGTDVWEINSNEAGAFNYSRFNTNATNFFNGNVPFAGSDHNPEIIGINTGGTANRRDIQIIGSNDFHGRLLGSSSDGGAAQLAGAVKSLKNVYGAANSAFVAAGDLIGASTFESFIDKDKPTLLALNAAGLEISSIGNHEFDQGYHDLIDRVMKPYNATTNPDGIPGGIQWQYIGSNVKYDGDPDGAGPLNDNDPIVLPTAVKDFGGGIKIGFVGAVTEDLPGLVSPAGLAGVKVTPIAAAVNQYAASLKAGADPVDLVVLLVHEGAPSTNCATMNTDGSKFDTLLGDISPDIDAVVSGHTHLEYSCQFTVPEWLIDGSHPIKNRPVVSAGQYGVALDQLVYSFDTATGKPVEVTTNNVGVKGPGSTLFNYPEDPTVKAIVDQAVVNAQGPGNVVVGRVSARVGRARLANGTTENRGGESTLGNLIAETQREGTPTGTGIAPAQIAFMNPGGLRDDIAAAAGAFPRDVTYRQAAAVQPFANTLVNMDLTGAQIKTILEQQWQRDALGNVPSRPFLRLGTSKGFTYTYTEANDAAHAGAKLGTVTAMYLNGTKIQPGTTYSVTMNSFLASGGDNFTGFLAGADKRDTGKSDLQATVEYMAAHAAPNPLDVDYAQHAVKATFPGGAPATYNPGDTVTFNLASLAMTAPADKQDTVIKVKLNGNQLGSDIPVDNTASATPDDNPGTALVSVTLPSSGLAGGLTELHVVGPTTGTDVIVPIQVTAAAAANVAAPDVTGVYGTPIQVQVTVTGNAGTPTGTVTLKDGATTLGSAQTLGADGKATITVPAGALPVGTKSLTVAYSGDGTYPAANGTTSVTVSKGTVSVTAPDVTAAAGAPVPVEVTVAGGGAKPTGTVTLKDGATTLGSQSLDANGKATITVPAGTLAPGTKNLTVSYAGDGNYQTGTGSTTVTISKASATVNVANVSVEYGKSAPVTVQVSSSPAATGSVTIKNGGTTVGTGTVSGGSATITLPAASLPVGTANLTADYSGDANVNGASKPFTVTVTKASSTTTASVSPKKPKKGHKYKVKVTVAGANGVAATGTVTVTVKGKKVTVTLVNGTATATMKGLKKKGSYTAQVAYSGDGHLNGSSTTVKFKVK